MLENIKGLKMNLQLFAEDEEELEEDLELDEDLGNEEKIEDLEDDSDEDLEDESDVENIAPDKKEKAIIKYKKMYKEQKEVNDRLLKEKQDKELELEASRRIDELTRDGISSVEATAIAEKEIDIKKLKIRMTSMELQNLETKYPGISAYAPQIAVDKENLPEFSYEQLYLAKYSAQSQFDTKTKLEQEMVYKNKNASIKSLDSSNAKQSNVIKMSEEDEQAYKIAKKQNPKLSKKRFLEILYD